MALFNLTGARQFWRCTSKIFRITAKLSNGNLPKMILEQINLKRNMKLIVSDKTKIQQKLIGSVSTLDEVLNRH